jgi:uncharacterized secreted protein with C-terminal beta-propeller domain
MGARGRLAWVVLVAAAVGISGTAESARAAKTERLVSFDSCREYLDYVKPRAVEYVHAFGFGGTPPVPSPPISVPSTALPSPGSVIPLPAPVPIPSAPLASPIATVPRQGVDFSGTNVQEEGVDEPDLVKTDGRTLYIVAHGVLSALDVSERRPRLVDSLELDDPGAELLLWKNRLLLLSISGYVPQETPAALPEVDAYGNGLSTLVEVDVSDPTRLRTVRTMTIDGVVLAARLVGGTVRLVTSAQIPGPLPFERPSAWTREAFEATAERNRMVFAESPAADWLPSYRIERGKGGPTADRPLVQCRHVRRPQAYSGLGMLTVVTLDLGRGLQPVSSTALMTDAGIVYASPESLYVATEAWSGRMDPTDEDGAPSKATTALHKFDIGNPERALYRGSGSIEGYLLSQWSLSEHRGVLRVVSTDAPAWWSGEQRESESFLTTLRQRDGALVQAGRVGGLGKGERVYAVRFVGDVGYVVTFREVDPLYTLDLSDPDRPRVLGELKIPGFSSYLHPIGEDLLLGVGQDVTEDGVFLGVQLSVFDVSDLRRPTRLHQRTLDGEFSLAEEDHRAFLYWPQRNLVVVPLDLGAAAVRVARNRGIEPLGEVEHEARDEFGAGILRSVAVRDVVLTISEAGVKANGMSSWDDHGWAALSARER